HLSDVHPANLDRTRFDVIEPRHESGHRALARAVLTNYRDPLARSNSKGGYEKRPRLPFISEFDRNKFESEIVLRERSTHRRFRDAWSRAVHRLQSADAGECSLRSRVKLCCATQRIKELGDEAVKSNEAAQTKSSGNDTPAPVTDYRGHRKHHRHRSPDREPTACPKERQIGAGCLR